MALKVDVVEHDGSRISGLEVNEIAMPGSDGQLGILPAHIQMISTVGIGPMKLTTSDGRVLLFALAGGFMEILEDRVKILVEACEASDDIDVERAQKALDRARSRLETISQASNPEEYKAAQASLKRALTRLAVASGKLT